MYSVLCAALLALTAGLVPAADQPKPNTLTPKEAAEGWLLLFDGETTFGWKIDGEARVVDGVLRIGGAKKTTAAVTTAFGEFDLRLESEGAAQLVLRTVGSHSSVGLTEQKSLTNLQVRITPGSGIVIETKGRTASDGTRVNDSTLHYGGSSLAPLQFEVPAGQTFRVHKLLLKPIGLKPIFNGKDLTGWKEFPGKKSKFTVTPEGWLNIANGPGDLQTIEQWDDFIVQIDCISNGKHLNSGVFFRCRPNEYQNGYEAQIQNGFDPEHPKEYTIEEYDPVTHQLVGKKKVKNGALDYGTGAIYRRVPARRSVAKDHEWFTMTILARGNHLAVWVNGIAVTDWIDNRPPSDNARTGCKLGKGPISLQGHDKTTNLSFRNIRIAELPRSPAAPR